MLRLLALAPLVAMLAGCITTKVREIDDAERAQLRTENKSIVLLHTALHDGGCTRVQLRLAQQDSSGRYVQTEPISLDGLGTPKVPSQITLPAGDYGIVGLTCGGSNHTSQFNARAVESGKLFGGAGAIYERPIATFKVGVGEVVDIGSLRLPTQEKPGGILVRRPGRFVAVVTPIPEERLKNLSAVNPKLVQDRIVRPMEGALRI